MGTHLDRGREAERRRLAQDLHDDTSQLLTSMRIELGVMRQLARSGPYSMAASVDRIDELIETSFAAYRRMIATLRPVILDDRGLGAATRWLCDEANARGPATIDVTIEGEFDAVDPDVALVAYRATQEALTNVARHANADRVSVTLRRGGDHVELGIHDDGAGFRPDEVGSDHLGLLILRERCRSIGGAVTVDSAPGRGTRIELRLPVTGSVSAEMRS